MSSVDEFAPSEKEEFRTMLRELISSAEANGVDVSGGWYVERPHAESDWDVEVTEVV
ncbi:hypothetical protein [Halogeometricum luteum]|uniref:Amphi-Trp domain-containing protein n=1 Tax=Halogeometricum luteum TaxID=2950537 RepID=A0ABU2G6U1_9EURY|nr:hypothetical protein [Halogeometricum sp. S3BR5-2]MDS0296497.1 hypothetical protein [Halogeometricum sp. S3BR5-2]